MLELWKTDGKSTILNFEGHSNLCVDIKGVNFF